MASLWNLQALLTPLTLILSHQVFSGVIPMDTQSMDTQVLKVGCTDDCEGEVADALAQAAKEKGVEIEWRQLVGPEDLQWVDGMVSPGGHDIHPRYFTKNVDPALSDRLHALHSKYGNDGEHDPEYDKRDQLEFAIMDAYIKEPLHSARPFLGVCYGMQVLAAASGVPLVVDLESQLGIPARRQVEDEIAFLKGFETHSLAQEMQMTNFRGPKRHHQAMDLEYYRTSPGAQKLLHVLATSNLDRIPEVIERKDRPALGIQYHAESSADKAVRLAPFRWLLEKMIKFKEEQNENRSRI